MRRTISESISLCADASMAREDDEPVHLHEVEDALRHAERQGPSPPRRR